ncbi:response regulator, partial [Corynebacterium nasicanis]
MIRIAIVDDESLVAQSLATLLSLEEDLEVVAVAASGEELLEWWRRGQELDVCVCDLQLGGIDGIETARRLGEVGVLIVTSHARPRALKEAL